MLKNMKLCSSLSSVGLTFGATAALMLPTAAQAQIEEIIVTAQRTSQNLQEVPVSVTALTQLDLEDQQVTDLLDLQYSVPNIDIGTNTGTANAARIFLRGVGEDESRGAVDPAVGIYVDGVYVARSVGGLLDVVDLEQVEVLRGPQGTLYGRNSNGGAIKLTSSKPSSEGSASALLTLGSDDRFNLRGHLDVGGSETTGFRVTAAYKSRDGHHTLNPNGDFANQAGTNVGKEDVFSTRAQFSQDLGADWNLLLSADYTIDTSDPVPDSAAPANDEDGNIFTIEPVPNTPACSALTPGTFQPLGCFSAYDNETRTQGLSATLSGSFANLNVESITAYRELNDDLTTRIGFPYFQETNQQQFSQEVTASTNFDGPFNLVGGVYYFNENLKLDTTFIFPFSIITSTESYALFGQGTYDVTDRLTLTGGLRYTNEEKEFEGINRQFGFNRIDDASFDNVSYTAKADYDITDNILGYVSYSTGFKSGGWSADAFSPGAVFAPVDEEEVKTFEAGVKTKLFDNMLRFNATYFNSDYTGLQIGATVPGLGFTRFNVDETAIQGLEFEATFAPTANFEINANLGLLDAEYESVTEQQAGGLTNNGVPCPGGIATVECALGIDLKNAPEYKGAISALYRLNAMKGEFRIGGGVFFEDDSWSLVANSPPHALKDIPTTINARIAYQPDNAGWNAAIWGKNLTDEEYYRAASGNSFTTYAAEPFTWGVDLGYKF